MEVPEGREKRNTAAIKEEIVTPMSCIFELSDQDISAKEIDGSHPEVGLNEVDNIKKQAANIAKVFNSRQNVEVFPYGGF